MNPNILNFRNSCAEDGVEMTPDQANKMFLAYVALKEEIEEAVEIYPNFYLDLCNRTTEENLKDIECMKEQGASLTLREYNDLQATIKKICELEGYA